MRCVVCNKALSDYESTRKVLSTGDYLDMCQDCYAVLDIPPATVDRKDLLHEADIVDLDDMAEFDYQDYDDLADYIETSKNYDEY